ncbi:hypothetical protein ACFQY9_04495 [Microvirga aerilata]|uniref:cadherin repeat domain-containing protein n=1 Tax=Microvirga aerilata TaxID=670292 RepID=UPI00362C4D50
MATILLTSNTIAENTEGQVRIGTLSIQDRPDETFIFTLDSELFEVVPDGEGSYGLCLKSGVTLDFESDPQFELAITVTDGAGDPVEVDPVIVDVTDVNEAPTDIAILGGSVADNADLGTLVATLQGEDPDEGDALTYTFVKSGQDHTEQSHAMFEIVGDEIQVKGDLSVGTHSLWVKVTDSGNPALSYVQEITLTVTVGNELPEVTFDLADVPEGAGAGTVVGTLAVSDPDGDDVTYSLVELDENGIERPSTMFRLDENGNVLVMDGVKLFQKDGAYPSFTVKASDGVDTIRSTYEVLLAENQEPVPAFESEELSRVVQEGTLVGVLSAYDEESDTVIFALEGVSADLLDLQDNGDGTWNVVVKAGVTLKYPDHTGFTVAVSDGINSFTETFHFNYLNEKPTISFEAAEVVDGAKAGTVVGTLTVSDAEGYDVEPILSSASAAVFDLVDNDDGTWSVVTRSRLDKNNSAQLEFTVTASDDENSVVETYELAIGDNQDPVVSSTPEE